ncbi:tRNA adenosine deaminase-associated protein [Actinacidiphila sp. bgisy167]|uniref:tRNA adenosine deaminase-associated protein n=1 Tax=Actinacidiphila sp. bgisy167 TaxID=3413797 RepID=UPI003D760559
MYFAALLARTEDGWEARETDLDDVETLGDLTDLARAASAGEDTVLVFIEQEDAWFGVVRVDGEEDPRIYVSDAAAAARSSYGEILLTDELLGRDPEDLDDIVDLDGTEEGDPDDLDDDVVPGPTEVQVPVGPLGDCELLADLGMSDKELLALSGDGALTGEALGEIADSLGCADVLEAVR